MACDGGRKAAARPHPVFFGGFIMRRNFAVLSALLFGVYVAAAPVPQPKENTGPREIDFAPLPTGPDYPLEITVVTQDNNCLKDTWNIGAFTSGKIVRNFVRDSVPAGWQVEADGDPA
jgi:hypothetical protein